MANINRCRVGLTGFAGGPGVATHYFDASVNDVTPIRVFWDSLKAQLPTVMQVQVNNSGDTINPADGTIVGAWSGPAQAVITGTGVATAYLSTAGIVVEWICPTPVNGRRPLGKTYIVPVITASFDGGTILNSLITSIQAAGLAMVQNLGGGGTLKVWHRPGKGLSNGSAEAVSNCRVPDKQVILRSRRG